jgi:ATP-dependent Clp protease ATP-binding subunit ClpC
MEIQLKFGDAVKKLIFEKGYDKKYGARPLKRAIQTNIEDVLAEAVLKGEIKRGDTVQVTVRNDKVKFAVKNEPEK